MVLATYIRSSIIIHQLCFFLEMENISIKFLNNLTKNSTAYYEL